MNLGVPGPRLTGASRVCVLCPVGNHSLTVVTGRTVIDLMLVFCVHLCSHSGSPLPCPRVSLTRLTFDRHTGLTQPVTADPVERVAWKGAPGLGGALALRA